MPSFLAVYDYGTGGVWLLLEAPTHSDAQNRFPDLKVFGSRPEWMSPEAEAEYRSRYVRCGFNWNVAEVPTGWLAGFDAGRR